MDQHLVSKERLPLRLRDMVITGLLSATYLILSITFIGFKTDQLVLVVVCNILYYATAATRKFILGFTVFIAYWVLYDSMKAYPNFTFNTVSIEDLYHLEKSYFGINIDGQRLTLNEYFAANGNTFVDILTGLFYLCWIPVPLAFALYLYFTKRDFFLYFLMSFFVVNFLGFIIYYLYPAAPPWYVEKYGFEFVPLTKSNTAGLIKFDQYFGISLFGSLYAKGSNVFAAMPSMHSAYPFIVLYYSIKRRLKWGSVLFAIVTVGIWFAAVYTRHHYVLDVVFGILVAILGIGLFNFLRTRVKVVRNFVNNYLAAIM